MMGANYPINHNWSDWTTIEFENCCGLGRRKEEDGSLMLHICVCQI